MKTYKYLIINSWDGVYIECTDDAVLDWILSEVTKLVPTCKSQTRGFGRKNWHIRLSKLNGEDPAIKWRIMEQLGRRGWEPFSVQAEGERGDRIYHHLRQQDSS